MKYWLNFCKRVFDIEFNNLEANIEEFNMQFGETKLKGSNIFFSQGVEDPWQWAGVREIDSESGSNMEAYVVNCTDCGHAVDFNREVEGEKPDLKNIRKIIRRNLSAWLKEGSQEEIMEDEMSMIVE